jgi:hypothetical protein
MTYTPAPSRGSCSTGKVQFASRKQARKGRQRIADSSLHAYRCPDCSWWHLGHYPARVRNGSLDKAEWEASRR